MEKTKSNRSFRILVVLLAGIGLFLSGSSFWLAEFQYQQDMGRRIREVNAQNANQTLALEQALNLSLAKADAVTQFIKVQMEAEGSLRTAHINLLKDFLASGFINQIAVADARGDFHFSALEQGSKLNIADREHFRAQQQTDEDKLYIAAPIFNQAAGANSIFLSRRLNSPDGRFAGIVSLGIAPDFFSQAFKQLSLGSDNSIIFLRTDGTFLARVPGVNAPEFQTTVKAYPVVEKLMQGLSAGQYESLGAADGIERVVSFQRLTDYPAVVLLTWKKQAAFAAVLARRSVYRTWAEMFSAAICLMLLLMWWHVRKQYQAEVSLQNANEELETKVAERTGELQAVNEELVAQNEKMAELQHVLTEQNRELTTKNEKIELLNNSLVDLNETLESRVEHRTIELNAAHQELTLQYEKLKTTQAALGYSEERFRTAMEFSEVAYFDGDLVHQKLMISDQWRERIGLPPGDALIAWDDYFALIHPEDLARRHESLEAYLQGNRAMYEVEYRLKLAEGDWIWARVRARAIRDQHGNPLRLLGTLSDISELKRREEREKFRAEHDELTGLLNQQGFIAIVSERLARQPQGTLMLLDIDDFEMFNAIHGRSAGDEYLNIFSRLLQELFGDTAVVSRFVGDGFGLYFPSINDSDQVAAAYEKMEAICVETLDGTFFVKLSVGVTLVANKPTSNLELLIQQADIALNHAKKQGKWCCWIYEPMLKALLVRHQVLREELGKSLKNQELHLVYQPIFNIREEQETVVGFEALLRWTSPTFGLVSPAEFIPVAENAGLILPIGKWVLEEACRFSAKYMRIFGHYANVAVNISTRQLALPSFADQVMAILDHFGVPATALSLEITESVLMADMEKCVSCLTNLRNFGVDISLDDFGTGYSSFTYLAKLPITTLKIDKSLLDQLDDVEAENSFLLLESLLLMSGKLNYRVVAEGVERSEQLRWLRKMNCHYCQGFLLGRPIPEEEVLAMVMNSPNITKCSWGS